MKDILSWLLYYYISKNLVHIGFQDAYLGPLCEENVHGSAMIGKNETQTQDK